MTERVRSAQFFAVPAATSPGQCRSCKAVVFWIETGSGKKMPIDCDVDGGAEPSARSGGQGVSHFVTCPDRDTWRKSR